MQASWTYGDRSMVAPTQPRKAMMTTAPKIVALAMVLAAGWKIWAMGVVARRPRPARRHPDQDTDAGDRAAEPESWPAMLCAPVTRRNAHSHLLFSLSLVSLTSPPPSNRAPRRSARAGE